MDIWTLYISFSIDVLIDSVVVFVVIVVRFVL